MANRSKGLQNYGNLIFPKMIGIDLLPVHKKLAIQDVLTSVGYYWLATTTTKGTNQKELDIFPDTTTKKMTW